MMTTNNVVDMFLVTIPWWDIVVPYCAPAVLKGIAKSHGFNIKTKDFSIDLNYKFSKKTNYQDYQNYFLSQDDRSKFPEIEEFYEHIVETIRQTPCRYLGISVFSIHTHRAALELLELIRQRLPDIKIVVGGRGLSIKSFYSIRNRITTAESMIEFHQILKKRNLVDYTILGDGEDAIVDLLSQDYIDNDARHGSLQNLDYPFSDFGDTEIDKYFSVGNVHQLPVISSKGCVRSCDFCDVAAHMKRFQSKDGTRLAQEMIHLADTYNVYEFSMADSIANGNMKELRKTCEALSQYNNENPNKRITWSGNWICRMPGNIKPEFFKLLAASGCRSLTIGVESGSNHVLIAMDKKTSVEGLFYEAELIRQNGMQFTVNNIIGHWSEHYEHFLEHLDMLIKLGPYFATRSITDIHIGIGYIILQNTPAAENPELLVDWDSTSFKWYAKNNPSLTFKARYARVLIAHKLAEILNYNVPTVEVKFLLNLIEKNIEPWTDWLMKHIDKDTHIECPSIELVNNIDAHVNERCKHFFPTSKIKLLLEASSCVDSPDFTVIHNGNEIVPTSLLRDGTHEFEFEITHDFEIQNRLQFIMTNKKYNDTTVDEQGNILKDKNIVFKKLIIDNIDLVEKSDFFYNKTKFITTDGIETTASDGLYFNGSWVLDYQPPFWRHYVSHISTLGDSRPTRLIESERMKIFADLHNEISKLEY